MTINKNNSRFGLIADIGGTNARFALIPLNATSPKFIQHEKTLSCADHPSLVVAIQAYYAMVGVGSDDVEDSTIAVAGPVDGDWFEMTNNPWAFSIRAVQQELTFKHFSVINDFAAVAWCVGSVDADDYVAIGAGTPLPNTPIAVIGPGTGLGVGGLVPFSGGFIPLATEGGHSTFAPTNELELEIVHRLQKKYVRVSSERLLSGPGIVDLYQAIADIEGKKVTSLSAAEITKAAVSASDTLCVTTFSHFCAILGSVAGDLALIMGAKGGVYIGGGIVPRYIDFLKESPFRKRFEAKGRFSAYNAAIPTRVLTAAQPGLFGSAAHLLAHADKLAG